MPLGGIYHLIIPAEAHGQESRRELAKRVKIMLKHVKPPTQCSHTDLNHCSSILQSKMIFNSQQG